ncbi:MAG: anthranilate synthase component I [Rhodospirillales bacterium]
MRVSPDSTEFAAAYAAGKPQVVWTEMVADLETPVSAMLKLSAGKPNSFLLESVEGGAVRGRYSFIGLKPDVIWRCVGDNAEINRQALSDAAAFAPCPVSAEGGTLASLRSLLAESRIDMPDGLPPMAAGLVGYMGYDTVRLVEDIPDDNPDVLNVPDGYFVRPTVMAVFDNIKDTITLITPVWPGDSSDGPDAALDNAVARLAESRRDLETGTAHVPMPESVPTALAQPVSNTGRAGYHAMVEKAKEYILAGDIFQVVPSQRFSFPFKLPPIALYRSLRRLNPSPFLFFLDFGDMAIVGSSPEILVRVRDGVVTIRPIAGTRPRGADSIEDAELAADLLADPKELAEHLMLLDLGRNDVGRVADIGTVTVTEQNVIEYYSHVMHIVSNVEGRLRADQDSVDALLAGFPAGTVSGAPKVRAMEIIDELEPERRGVYAGCIGYFGANGEMDTCIALRTAVIKDGKMYVQAGGGVVADSDPEFEYQESCNKAKALIRAAEEAVRFVVGN